MNTDPHASGAHRPRIEDASGLDLVLESHRRWIETEGREGASATLRGRAFDGADLSGAMLRGADLTDARFRNAVLAGADLSGSGLAGADFQGADLARADLRAAELRDASFHDASLANADLTDARGLLGGQLAGANLSGAKIPESAARFEGLNNVAEASKATQSLFATILLVCSYVWMTIASTTDPQLLNNAAPPASRLPILGTDIPLVRFYMVAPLLLLCLYVYFHLCLQRLWEELAELPAVFPDGRPLDKKAYPWLMNVIVGAHVPRLRAHRSHLTRWQSWMSIVLGWGLVPFTLVLLWVRYVRAHDWTASAVHVILIAAAIGAGTGFLFLAASTLRGSEKRPFLWRKAWSDARARCFGMAAVALVIFGVLSYGGIEGIDPRIGAADRAVHGGSGFLGVRRYVPQVFVVIGFPSFAFLDDASLSTKPANWTGKTLEVETVKGADLTHRDLRYASAYNSFGVNAYLMDADLRGADFRESDFRSADFRRANLSDANFRSADLEKADFRGTNLTQARLVESNIAGANFTEAILTDAQLREAKAKGAIFNSADLRGANLRFSDLAGADLRDANLRGTVLTNADLSGADLTGASGLTASQIASCRVDALTKMPAGLATEAAKLATQVR